MSLVILYERRRVLEFLLTAAPWYERLEHDLLQFARGSAFRQSQFSYNSYSLTVLLNFGYELPDVLILQLEGVDL